MATKKTPKLMEIEEVNIAVIKPYWRNPRNNDKAIEGVAQSIRDYGFNSPIIVDKEYTIVAGHTRYKALQQLGYEVVPVVVVDLPAQKVKEYRIADNKTAELGDWDYPKLILELKEIADLPTMQTYFNDLDVQSVVDSLPKSVASDVTVKEVADRMEIMASDYTTRNKEEQRGFIPMICPDCGYEYSLNIDAIQHMIDGIRKQIAYNGVPDDTEDTKTLS